MIQRIKKIVLKALSEWYKFFVRLKGVNLGEGCFVNKMPDIRCHKGSSIIIGKNVTLTSNSRHNPLTEHPVRLRTLSDNAIIEMKENSGISGASIICTNRITIGENTIIGANTLIYDSDGHSYSPEKGWNTPRLMTGRPISIGKKCFIGTGCKILGGVTIGDRCFISAGTVISQNIPNGSFAKGNPAVISPLPKSLGGPEDVEILSPKNNESSILTEDFFLASIKKELELEFHPRMNDQFRDYDEWDSLAFLTLVSWLKDSYNFELNSDKFNHFQTWEDIYKTIHPLTKTK